MGLFASRPEEPFEWAGLPSEPHKNKTDAEFLADPPADPFAIRTDSGPSSISITLSPSSTGSSIESGVEPDSRPGSATESDDGS